MRLSALSVEHVCYFEGERYSEWCLIEADPQARARPEEDERTALQPKRVIRRCLSRILATFPNAQHIEHVFAT